MKEYDDSRILAVEYNKEGTSMLLLCVYLPYQCNDNYNKYLNCMNKSVQIVYEYPNAFFISWVTSTQILVAGICLGMNLCKYVMNIHCLLQMNNYYLISLSLTPVMLMAQRPG